ncbi:hypothetical protein ACOMHN_060979 [Nucella lapillus]
MPTNSASYPWGRTGDTHELRFLPLGSLDYQHDQNYQVMLLCTDNSSTLVKTVVFYLRIEPNTPPYFTTFFIRETRQISQMTQLGLNLKNYCQDNDLGRGDTLTFTLKSTISRSPFFKLSRVLKGVGELQRECGSPVSFVVECGDRYGHRATHPLTVQLTLQDGNHAPIILGINTALTIPENSGDGSSLSTFSVQEGGNRLICSLLSSNPDLSQFFHLKMLGTRGSIAIKGNLNYEAFVNPRTNLTVTCSDRYCTSSAAYVYVTVTNVNEPVKLHPQVLTLSSYEGEISLKPNWAPIDEDKNDRHIFRLVGSNTKGRFTIHPVTGLITSTLDYDVDQGAMPSSQILLVEVADQGGHKSSASVTVTILDSNDNTPSFFSSPYTAGGGGSSSGSSTKGQSSSVSITNCTTTFGSSVGRVVATDRDSSFQGNNFITYSVTAGPFVVDRTGDVRVSGHVTVGMTYVVKVTATDAGKVPNGPLTSSAPAVINVFVIPCPKTTTTTTTTSTTTTTTEAPATTAIPEQFTGSADSRSKSARNVGWIIVAGILAATFICSLGLMLWRFCWPWWTGGKKMSDVCGNICDDMCRP